ncbi:helix-turn-helix transcriptional regulator [Aurantimonas sp. E1-2-R+4]
MAVGRKLKIRRTAVGMSQGKLAERLGVTFQQVQKYEKGANRLAASTLYRAGRALSVPVEHFFEGVDDVDVETEIADLNPAAYREASAFMKIEDAKVRAAISALVQVLAADDQKK